MKIAFLLIILTIANISFASTRFWVCDVDYSTSIDPIDLTPGHQDEAPPGLTPNYPLNPFFIKIDKQILGHLAKIGIVKNNTFSGRANPVIEFLPKNFGKLSILNGEGFHRQYNGINSEAIFELQIPEEIIDQNLKKTMRIRLLKNGHGGLRPLSYDMFAVCH